jgi:hypothetical protein
MKRALIVCLAIVTLLAVENSAEAGRRKERRTAKKGGAAAAAYYRPRQTTAVAAAPVAAGYAQPTIAPAPDLTITEIAVVGDALAFTVKNIGQAASPETRLDVTLTKPQAEEFESQNVRVLPLLPDQSVRIRINSVPAQSIRTIAFVDPDHLVAESNEQNNELRLTFAADIQVAQPPTLADENVWTQEGN